MSPARFIRKHVVLCGISHAPDLHAGPRPAAFCRPDGCTRFLRSVGFLFLYLYNLRGCSMWISVRWIWRQLVAAEKKTERGCHSNCSRTMTNERFCRYLIFKWLWFWSFVFLRVMSLSQVTFKDANTWQFVTLSFLHTISLSHCYTQNFILNSDLWLVFKSIWFIPFSLLQTWRGYILFWWCHSISITCKNPCGLYMNFTSQSHLSDHKRT